MQLQSLIDDAGLELRAEQVRAFFLGAQIADRPMSYQKAVEEVLADVDVRPKELMQELAGLWKSIETDRVRELENFFPDSGLKLQEFLDGSQCRLDYFLTALSLAGTNGETAQDEDFGELIEYLEETMEELDELLSEAKVDKEEGEEIKEDLLSNWKTFMETRR